MMLKVFVPFKICLLLLTAQLAFAQQRDTLSHNLLQHFNYYRIKKSDISMFVHTDKTIYTNNDIIWFTAYLLNIPLADMGKHQVLSAALVNNYDHNVAVQNMFVMTRGLAHGSLTVPDTLSPGNYSFIAYTNRMVNDKPEVLFKQSITIKSVTQPAFNAELTIDTLNKTAGMVHAIIRATGNGSPLNGAAITYQLGQDRLMRLAGKARIDETGIYSLMIPQSRINQAQHTLEVQVKYNKEIKTLHLVIPVAHQLNDVKFYPEGGNLVAGIGNNVGWEAKSASGVPLKTKAVLYSGKKTIDTIETDSFGMGRFYFTPLQSAIYKVKLLQDNTDSVYALPVVLSSGLVLNIPEALVADTLTVQLKGTYTGKAFLLVHNYKQLFTSTSLNVSPRVSLVKIVLTQLPRGLNTITILDSLQRPCAERLFFAHYNRKPKMNIVIDQPDKIITRKKVNVELKLTDEDGKPTKGIVSVACVQDNRLEIKNENNIEHYVYLQSEIDNLPLKDSLLGNAALDRQYLNELLLVRGWSKYKWAELVQSTAADTLKKQDSLVFTGKVWSMVEQIRKPQPLIVMRDSVLGKIMNTDDDGNFKLTNDLLYTFADKKVKIVATGLSKNYLIKIDDPYAILNKILAQTVKPVIYQEPFVQSTNNMVLKGFEHATNLKEVKIKSSKDGFISAFANACGDYVCVANILNCPRHGPNDPGNRRPVVGEKLRAAKGPIIIYQGCDMDIGRPGTAAIKGIYGEKEFYGANYAVINTTEPDYQSTIYWKHSIVVDPGKPTELSFYTSDITGKFRIVVQGITNTDVVYGENSFTVAK